MTTSWLLLLCITITAAQYYKPSPYKYQKDPMGSVPVSQDKLLYNPLFRMIGEQFFKQDGAQTLPGVVEEDDEEQLPYTVIQDYGSYEKRQYPQVSMVCTYDTVDTAGDPLAGLKMLNPWKIMQSRRFNKTPQSIMFKRLFRYISGVNQREEEVEMTTPVSTLHKVVRQDRLGNVELQLMCFYLPAKYQPQHSHEGPAPRHEAISPPLPMEGSKVVLHSRPELEVYVRQFGGWALSAHTWETQRQTLLNDLAGRKVNKNEFFCASYDSPHQMENRRNEVWVQSTEGEAADLSFELQELVQAEQES